MNSLSFKYRFILTFVIVEIFFILLIVGLNFLSINTTTEKLIKKEITTTKHLLESLIKLPLSVFDLATLDDISTQSTVGSLNSIIIYDPYNNILSKNYNINTSISKLDTLNTKNGNEIYENDNRYILELLILKEEDTTLGSAVLIFDTNEIDKQIDKNKTNIFLIIFIEIILSTYIAYILGRNLTNKLSRLAYIARKIGKEEQVKIDYENENNELALLNNSMVKMLEDLSTRNEKLTEAKIVFDNISEAIIFLDSNKKIISANNSFYKITNLNKQNVINNNFFKLLSINFNNISNNQKNDIKIKIENNNELTVLLKVNEIKDDENNIKNYIILFVDITKEKRKEDLLQIQSKMATMGEMLGNIAHQWRQPLSSISTITSTLKIQSELDVLEKEKLQTSLDNIINSTKYLSETIDDFSQFFKVDKNIESFTLGELFNSLEKIVSARIAQNKIALNIEEEHLNTKIKSSKNELIQSLINIINNSIDALVLTKKNNPRIDISLKLESDYINILIQDNGGGIKEEILPRIFEPYFTTKHKSQGTGIGLYMTHTIINQNCQGEVFASNMRNGTLFTVRIPYKL
ncbi:MAG: PAS domain-containing sensor histidine kinase [Sulfurovum sp.]